MVWCRTLWERLDGVFPFRQSWAGCFLWRQIGLKMVTALIYKWKIIFSQSDLWSWRSVGRGIFNHSTCSRCLVCGFEQVLLGTQILMSNTVVTILSTISFHSNFPLFASSPYWLGFRYLMWTMRTWCERFHSPSLTGCVFVLISSSGPFWASTRWSEDIFWAGCTFFPSNCPRPVPPVLGVRDRLGSGWGQPFRCDVYGHRD